jgi:hypothetical protein
VVVEGWRWVWERPLAHWGERVAWKRQRAEEVGALAVGGLSPLPAVEKARRWKLRLVGLWGRLSVRYKDKIRVVGCVWVGVRKREGGNWNLLTCELTGLTAIFWSSCKPFFLVTSDVCKLCSCERSKSMLLCLSGLECVW